MNESTIKTSGDEAGVARLFHTTPETTMTKTPMTVTTKLLMVMMVVVRKRWRRRMGRRWPSMLWETGSECLYVLFWPPFADALERSSYCQTVAIAMATNSFLPSAKKKEKNRATHALRQRWQTRRTNASIISVYICTLNKKSTYAYSPCQESF